MAALPADLSVFKSNPNARLPYDASRAANALGFDPSVDPAVIDYQPTNPGGRLCLCRGATSSHIIAGWHNFYLLCYLNRDCAALPFTHCHIPTKACTSGTGMRCLQLALA